jgi:hypothetical protein
MTHTTKATITATAIYKVTSKATNETCYMVPSDSQANVYYKACWNESESRWTCTCKAGENGRACKHTAAAQVSVLANKPLETSQKGSLHSAKAFSLMR